MKQLLVIALLLIPQLAAARVYMCVDPVTGETSFTDKACKPTSAREEVRVNPSNLNSGKQYAAPEKAKTWRSQADTRKTGVDYNAERRSTYDSKATVSAR
jgi:hypothetical protein